MPDTALVVMARYPLPGTTKTRLASTLGEEETLNLYRAFLTDLACHFAEANYDLYWAYTPAGVDYAALLATLAPDLAGHARNFPQEGTNLNERLLHVFEWGQQHGYTSTIVIGSDTPHITHDVIVQASEALQEADVVLGPADDGGYYLIAMHEPHDVFSGIPMSTSVVGAMTVAKAHGQGLKVSLLELLFDIDEYADLLRLATLLRENSELAPATAAQIGKLEAASGLVGKVLAKTPG